MSSGRRKLLLADDSPTIQKVISLTFGDDGEFEVVTVGDGAQALRALAQDPPPDVVLADVVMPGPDGYELCERIKRDERLKNVPVVLLVGTFEPFNEAEARRVGADTVLTKPFQSIRNLVGKVGSLLGGESKADEPAEVDEPRDERRHEETHARAAASSDEPAAPRAEEASASFADLASDDELIEARPAEAFAAPPAFAHRHADPPADVETDEAYDAEFAPAYALESQAAAPQAPVASEEEPDDFVLAVEEADEAQPAYAAALPRENVMTEPTSPQTSFEARSASAAAADDALLDLGQTAAPAAVATAEADDFILDLGFDDDAAAPQSNDFDSPLEVEPAPAWADAPSAFAEAAHGEPAHALDQTAASFEPSPSFEASADFAQPEASGRDVVVQDGPLGFAFGGEEPQALAHAPRGFVEPEVVPADDPVPATVEGEFTDGSVEGDLPRAPTAQASVVEAVPQEPTAAGYSVMEGHTRVEEPLRAEQLSQQAIDAIARRVVELMSDKVVREVAWEVVPELAELLIKRKMEEERRQ